MSYSILDLPGDGARLSPTILNDPFGDGTQILEAFRYAPNMNAKNVQRRKRKLGYTKGDPLHMQYVRNKKASQEGLPRSISSELANLRAFRAYHNRQQLRCGDRVGTSFESRKQKHKHLNKCEEKNRLTRPIQT